MDKCVNCVGVGVSAFPETNWKAVTVTCCVCVCVSVHVQVDESDSCTQSLAHGVPPAALQCKLAMLSVIEWGCWLVVIGVA